MTLFFQKIHHKHLTRLFEFNCVDDYYKIISEQLVIFYAIFLHNPNYIQLARAIVIYGVKNIYVKLKPKHQQKKKSEKL